MLHIRLAHKAFFILLLTCMGTVVFMVFAVQFFASLEFKHFVAGMEMESLDELVEKLGQWTPIPTTYAGGANSLADLEEVTRLGREKIDLTIGSALDIFGGTGVKYQELVTFNREKTPPLQRFTDSTL